MKKILLSTVTAALLALPAFAVDAPVKEDNHAQVGEHKNEGKEAHRHGKKEGQVNKNAQKNKDKKNDKNDKNVDNGVENPEPTTK